MPHSQPGGSIPPFPILDGDPKPPIETLLEFLPGMFYRARQDKAYSIVSVSGDCRGLTGFTAKELAADGATNFRRRVHKNDRRRVLNAIRKALEKQTTFETRYRIRSASGDFKVVWERGRGVFQPDGTLVALEGMVRDATETHRMERALRDAEAKFSKAFRTSPIAMALSEPGGRGFIEINESYRRLFGFSREELIGVDGARLKLWRDVRERGTFFREFGKRGRVRDMEVVRCRKDGTHVICLISAEPLMIGGRKCMLTVLRDITARRQAERALRISESKFTKAFHAAPDAMFITDIDTGRIVEANGGCQRIFGYSRQECIGRTSLEVGIFAHRADRQKVIDLLRATGTVRELEIVGRHRSGETVTVLASCDLIDWDGEPHIMSIAHDVTARKSAEKAMRESEAKFARAFEAVPCGIGISELEKQTYAYIEVNDHYCQMFGYRREEMIGRSALDLGIWGTMQERDHVLGELARAGRVRDMEISSQRRDGTAIFILVSIEVIELRGRPHLLSCVYDVTARRRAEQARADMEAQLRQAQKLDALGQLAGGIAHDFNNILTGIGAYTELALLDIANAEDVKRHLHNVQIATARATDLVRQILTFSRQKAPARRPTKLAVVAREAVSLLRSSMPKSVELVERFERDTPIVLADATQIHQVLMNLCTNALHAMRNRPGRLTLVLEKLEVDPGETRSRTDLEPGRYARLLVADTGHGMDAAMLPRIFEPFFTTKEPGEGTGLGLSVVHGIVEEHDASITVQSRPGEGTTFEICFPEHRALEAHAADRNQKVPLGRNQRILLIDDEVGMAAAVAELMKRIGYQVTLHSDARMAWREFEHDARAYDAVLTDLTMPHLTGVEFAQRALAKRPDLPVLVASGHFGAWTPDALHALGVRSLIVKPLTAQKIARALHEVFGDKKQDGLRPPSEFGQGLNRG